MLICPLALTREWPLKSTEPTKGWDCSYLLYPLPEGEPSVALPIFQAGEPLWISRLPPVQLEAAVLPPPVGRVPVGEQLGRAA